LDAFDVTGFKELAGDVWHMLTTHKARGGTKMAEHYLMWSAIFMIIFAVIFLLTYLFIDNVLFRSKSSAF
jgi:hypothetical protein